MCRREVGTASLVRRFLGSLLRPLHRLLIRHVVVDDPWEPVTSFLVKPQIFGPGSLRMFPWYFEGESTVKVGTVDDVCRWLAECQYVPDEQLFNEADFWQHPRTFEHLRKGDCEDHALWAWRKLVELGHRAELFVGQWLGGASHGQAHHAWVVFERDGQSFLLEPVTKDGTPAVRPLGDVRTDYVPHFSVDSTFKMRSHAGYLLYLRDRDGHTRKQAA